MLNLGGAGVKVQHNQWHNRNMNPLAGCNGHFL